MTASKKRFLRFVAEKFPALTHKEYRYYWFGQCISSTGNWMQTIAQSWLVYSLTNSPALLGITGAVQFLPIMFFSLFSGVLIDRFSKRNILLLTQISLMVLAVILGVLCITHVVRYEMVLVIAFLQGTINSLDMPVRQAIPSEIAGERHFVNAISLNSTVFNLTRLIGPAIAAYTIKFTGIGFCFIINAISFIPVIIGILKIRSKKPASASKRSMLSEVKEGLKYIISDKQLVIIFIMVFAMGTFTFNFNVLLPILAKAKLLGDEATYAALTFSLGLGSLIAALVKTQTGRSMPKNYVIPLFGLIAGVTLIITGFPIGYFLTCVVLVLQGFFNLIFNISANTALQLRTDYQYRGRVMSLYTFMLNGTTPVGNTFSGFVSESYGINMGFISCGIANLLIFIPLGFMLLNKKDKKCQ